MTDEFFRAKRPWSRYKDRILRDYIDPYLAKVKNLRVRRQPIPIEIVDCFAGRGRYGDGEPGSPIIIAEAIRRWRNKGVDVTGVFIEADVENFDALAESLKPHYDYSTLRQGPFEDEIRLISLGAAQKTTFLYVDPYTVRALEFAKLKAVYDQIFRYGASVEVLLNFNVVTFMRWALAALKRHAEIEFGPGSQEVTADDPNEHVEIDTLNAIAGGEYWQRIASDQSVSFSQQVERFTVAYTELLQESFPFVASCAIRERSRHQVPKYVMFFGTRHQDGIILMSDGMCRARQQALGYEFRDRLLFDCKPDLSPVGDAELCAMITDLLNGGKTLTRKQLDVRLLQAGLLGRTPTKQIHKTLEQLLKEEVLVSSTGKTRINDETKLRIARS